MRSRPVFSAHPSTKNVPDPGIERANTRKMAIVLKYRMQEEEAFYYLCSKKKGAAQLLRHCFRIIM